MPEVVIRQVQAEEMLELASPIRAYSFSSTPPLPEREKSLRRLPYEKGDIHFILFEDNKPMACVSSQRLTQQVRGKIYKCGGVRGVATHPAARLKGYAWLLLNHLFEAFHTTSIPLSTLYPFRESFYERLGYTIFPQPRIAHLETSALLPLLKKKFAGNVELLSIVDGYETYRAYLYKQQQKRHGMALFSENFASSLQDENTMWLACARDENGLECGMMLYYIQEYLGNIIVSDFCYDTSLGRSLLLEWLARHIDQMKKIEIILSPDEHPETGFQI
jgi:predicted acetyltransferase